MHRDSEGARAHFALRYASDRDAGRVRPAAEYLALYPGFEDTIRDQLARFEALAARPGTAVAAAAPRELAGYSIERELGRGGQGTVYLATDRRLRRSVALKVLERSAAGSGDAVFRFRREAEILAALDHPAICPVFDSGIADGQPYIAMRLVAGDTLAQGIAGDRRPGAPPPDWRARVRLVEAAARAVHHAHAAGVMHRDIKPQNIMVTPAGAPVILDFGLARALDGAMPGPTATGDVLGTPAYMAPEQVSGGRAPVDARCDIYALAVVLYEALTLERPFGGATREDLYRAILSGDASDLRRRNAALPRDLAVVVQKAMEREPDRRYRSADAFAEDLARVLEGAPVRARRPGPLRRLGYWRRKHPALASSAALAVVAAGVLGAFQQHALERERADKVALEIEKSQVVAALARAEGHRLSLQSLAVTPADSVLGLLLAVEAARRAPGAAANTALWRALAGAHETFVLRGHDGAVEAAAFSADGRRIVTADSTLQLLVWDSGSGRQLARLEAGTPSVVGLTFVPGGDAVVFGGSDGRLRLWRFQEPGPPRAWPVSEESLRAVRVSPDGATALVAAGNIASTWDLRTGALERTFEAAGAVVDVAWAGSVPLLLEKSRDGAAVRDCATGRRVALSWPADLSEPESLGFLGDGRTVLSLHGRHEFALWSSGDGTLIRRFRRDGDADGFSLPLSSANGRYLVAGSDSRSVWDVEHGAYVAGPPGPPLPEPIHFGAPSPDGRWLAAWSVPGRVATLYDARSGRHRETLGSHGYQLVQACWSPDGRRLLTLSRDATARLWDLDQPLERRGLMDSVARGGVRVAALFPDGRSALVRDDRAERVLVLDIESGERRTTIDAVVPATARVDVDAAGDRVLVLGDGWLQVFDAHTGALARGFADAPGDRPAGGWTGALGLSPDGRSRIVETAGGTMIEPDVGNAVRRVGTGLPAFGKAWSPDGRTIAASLGEKHGAVLVDAALGTVGKTLFGHTGFITTVEFSRDGRRIVTAAVDTSARVWDAETGALLATLSGLPMGENAAAFSPDGRLIAVRCETGETQFFDAATGAPHGTLAAGTGVLGVAGFTSDGRSYQSCDSEGLVRQWPLDPLEWAAARLPRSLEGREVVAHQIGTKGEQRAYADRWTLEHGNQRQRLSLALRRLASGDFDGAESIARESMERRPGYPDGRFGLACVLARRGRPGDLGLALDELEAAVRAGWNDFERLRLEPSLEILRGDPRFVALLR